MTDRFEGHPTSSDLGDDLLGGLGPDERNGILVVMGDVVLDGFGDATEATPPDPFGRDHSEPPLDLI